LFTKKIEIKINKNIMKNLLKILVQYNTKSFSMMMRGHEKDLLK